MVARGAIPCAECHGWVDRDRTVMDRETALARYPGQASLIMAAAPHVEPVREPSPTAQAMREIGRAIGTSLRLIQALAALAIIVIVLYLIVRAFA